MRRVYFACFLLVAVAISTFVACGGGSTSTSFSQSPTANAATVFVTGSDAPLASVVGFQVTLKSLTLSDGTNTVSVLSQDSKVDFSKLLGLRTLLALNQVAPGTYTSATLTIADPVISYLNMGANPPSITTMNGYFGSQGTTSTTIQLALNPNMVVSQSGLAGLHLHFDLKNSIITDSNGQITGQVSPQIQLRALAQNDDDAHVDELLGGVVSVDTANNKFVMQLPHGRQVTVAVNNQTQWEGTFTLASLLQNYTVEVAGLVQRDGSLLADDVDVVSTDKFYLGGLVLQVVPQSGQASSFTMFVRTEVPDLQGISVPGTANLNIADTTNFDIRRFGLPMGSLLFNRSMMVVAQRVGVGGTVNSDNSLNVKRIVLKRQGVEGHSVANSVVITGSDKEGYFQLQNNGMFGYILGDGTDVAPIKVMTSNMTVFRNLPNHLNDVQDSSARLQMWGLILKDPTTSTPVFVAGYIAKMN